MKICQENFSLVLSLLRRDWKIVPIVCQKRNNGELLRRRAREWTSQLFTKKIVERGRTTGSRRIWCQSWHELKFEVIRQSNVTEVDYVWQIRMIRKADCEDVLFASSATCPFGCLIAAMPHTLTRKWGEIFICGTCQKDFSVCEVLFTAKGQTSAITRQRDIKSGLSWIEQGSTSAKICDVMNGAVMNLQTFLPNTLALHPLWGWQYTASCF